MADVNSVIVFDPELKQCIINQYDLFLKFSND